MERHLPFAILLVWFASIFVQFGDKHRRRGRRRWQSAIKIHKIKSNWVTFTRSRVKCVQCKCVIILSLTRHCVHYERRDENRHFGREHKMFVKRHATHDCNWLKYRTRMYSPQTDATVIRLHRYGSDNNKIQRSGLTANVVHRVFLFIYTAFEFDFFYHPKVLHTQSHSQLPFNSWLTVTSDRQRRYGKIIKMHTHRRFIDFLLLKNSIRIYCYWDAIIHEKSNTANASRCNQHRLKFFTVLDSNIHWKNDNDHNVPKQLVLSFG